MFVRYSSSLHVSLAQCSLFLFFVASGVPCLCFLLTIPIRGATYTLGLGTEMNSYPVILSASHVPRTPTKGACCLATELTLTRASLHFRIEFTLKA